MLGRTCIVRITLVWAVLLAGTLCLYGDFELDWWTVDGGGAMLSIDAADTLELSGTIGQPDAGFILTGGTFELAGGFWPGAPVWRLGDVNCDNAFDAADIWPFFLIMQDPAQYWLEHSDCDMFNGDINSDGAVDGADIWPFFELLSG